MGYFVKRYWSSQNSSTIPYAFIAVVAARKQVRNKYATWYLSIQDSSTVLEVSESTKLEYGSDIISKMSENHPNSYSSFQDSSTLLEVPKSTKLEYGLGIKTKMSEIIQILSLQKLLLKSCNPLEHSFFCFLFFFPFSF